MAKTPTRRKEFALELAISLIDSRKDARGASVIATEVVEAAKVFEEYLKAG